MIFGVFGLEAALS